MKDNLIEEEDPIIQKFEIEEKVKDETAPKVFISNVCPINLGGKRKLEYHFGSIKNKRKFDSSEAVRIFNIEIWMIIFMILISMLFYDLLITYIIHGDIKLLIFFIIVYIFGTIFQLKIVPEPLKFKPKSKFENVINSILNSYVKFKVSNKKGKQATLQGYTIDITGTLNIPSQYNYARIKAVQLYDKFDLYTLIQKFNSVYGGGEVNYRMEYKNEPVNFNSSVIYAISSNNDLYTINIFTTIFSILLLQWINALYYNYSVYKKCVDIYFAKLVTDEIFNSPSKVTIHGKKIRINPSVKIPIKSDNDEFEEKYEEFKRKEKEMEILEARVEKRERENQLEREKNTSSLSYFSNRNYIIEVKKVYNNVHIEFIGFTRKGNIEYKAKLGEYDPNAEEKIEVKNKMTVYYPKGFNIRIEILRDIYSYTISIGDKYTKNIEYY